MDRFLDLFGPLGYMKLRIAPRPTAGTSVAFTRRFIFPLAIGAGGMGCSVLAVGVVGMLAGTPAQHSFGPALLIALPLFALACYSTIMIETVTFFEDGTARFGRKCIPWGRSFKTPRTADARIAKYGVVAGPTLVATSRSQPKYFMAVAFVNHAITPLAFTSTEDEVERYLAELPELCQSFVDFTQRTAFLQSTLRGRMLATPARSILASVSE